MFVFINGVEKTESFLNNSIKIDENLREAPNRLTATMVDSPPSDFDDIKCYAGYVISSSTVNSVTLEASFRLNENELFRVGDILTVAINESDEEEAIIASISNENGKIKLTLNENFTDQPASGELAGKLMFAGNAVDMSDENIVLLKNITYSVNATDYTRIFDKQVINDTYENRNSRYIINDFCNKSVNYNAEIDEINYLNNTAIQAIWAESGDGNNPTVDLSDFREGIRSGVFSWTHSGGSAAFTSAPIDSVLNDFTGVDSGAPTKGVLGLWIKATDYTAITSIEVRIGSDSTNYISLTVSPTNNDWVFHDLELRKGTLTGSPNWLTANYIQVIVNQTGTSSIRMDGLRILEKEFFRHYPFVGSSLDFESFRINRIKPVEVMKRLADELSWFWYVDYRRHIHLFPQSEDPAPFEINETSNNFSEMTVRYDTSRLINRQVIMGADETSTSVYGEVREGDAIQREWLMKNLFKNLEVSLNDGSVTDTMEAGTNTTTVNATAHGLVVGDYIVNRSRANAVRKVLTVPSLDSFTVDAVTSQTNGDTFSLFVPKSVGVEGLTADADHNYMSNFLQKSIRSSEDEDTLTVGQFLLFRYNEVIPILVQRTENVSVQKMKDVLGHSSGIIDGQPIVDRTLKTRSEAINMAKAILNKYSNLIINVSFKTYISGLHAGQFISIKDTASGTRNLNQSFMIQSVRVEQVEWGYFVYRVQCSSLLFGMLELLQQLLRGQRKIDVDQDAVINNIEDGFEDILVTDTVTIEDRNVQEETITISDSITLTVFEPPFKWGPDPNQGRWNLCSWD